MRTKGSSLMQVSLLLKTPASRQVVGFVFFLNLRIYFRLGNLKYNSNVYLPKRNCVCRTLKKMI